MKHIDHPLVAKTHTPMYLMHKYWARKPHNVVQEYIKIYSKKGEIVFDPFAGSGPTAIESLRLGRKTIGLDLDPMSIFITKCTVLPVKLEDLIDAFNSIEKDIKKNIDNLYKSKCPDCKKEIIYDAMIWVDGTPREIRYTCDCQKNKRKKSWKKVSDEDIKKIKSIAKKRYKWYPKNQLIWNSRINVHKGEKVSELFTKRNLYVLSLILDRINNIRDKNVREILRFTFSSALPQASKLVFVIRKRGRSKGKVKESYPEVGSWATRGYWVPKEYFEINAWNCFEERFNKIKRGKKESNKVISNFKEVESFGGLKDNSGNIWLLNQSALDLSNIPANSIDYIFTDPPYGDAVPYLELDYMWSSWMKFDVNFEDEIIISDSPIRKKTPDVYEKMLKAAFKQIYRVLKPNKYMTVTFHSTNIKIWNAIIKSVVFAGFDLEKIIYQPPARTSAKGLLAPYGSAVGDYYIRFKKPKEEKLATEREIDLKSYENEVINAAKRIIGERTEPTSYQHILNGIMVELKGGKRVPIGAKNIEDVLKENVNTEFELVDVKDEKGKVIGKKWWVKGWDLTHFSQPILSDRLERAVISLLDQRFKVSFDDVLQEIFIQFPNALTPDTQDIKDILREYAETTKDGNWRLKSGYSEAERISRHSEMIFYLANIGRKLGYNIWIGQREQGETFNKTRLSEFCDRLPTFRFISQEPERIDRIRHIDVIWHKDGVIKYEFEIENTTSITDAIIRGSNIKPIDDSVSFELKRYIVIPKSRMKLLVKKLDEPLIKRSLVDNVWKFIIYEDLRDYYSQVAKKKKIKSSIDFETLAQIPKLINQKQSNLQEFSE